MKKLSKIMLIGLIGMQACNPPKPVVKKPKLDTIKPAPVKKTATDTPKVSPPPCPPYCS